MKYYPLPNQPGTVNAGLNNYFSATTSVLNSDTVDAKVDENINAKNRFFFRYSERNQRQPPPIYLPAADVVAQIQCRQ